MTKQQLIDNTLELIRKNNELAETKDMKESKTIDIDHYSEIFKTSKKAYIGECNLNILRWYNHLKLL